MFFYIKISVFPGYPLADPGTRGYPDPGTRVPGYPGPEPGTRVRNRVPGSGTGLPGSGTGYPTILFCEITIKISDLKRLICLVEKGRGAK